MFLLDHLHRFITQALNTMPEYCCADSVLHPQSAPVVDKHYVPKQHQLAISLYGVPNVELDLALSDGQKLFPNETDINYSVNFQSHRWLIKPNH